MKPWEQTWDAVQFNSGGWLKTELHHGEGQVSCLDWGEASTEDPGDAAEDLARAKLAAAAPEMARLLKALHDEHGDRHTFDWAYWHDEIEAVLLKAGVPRHGTGEE
jgi:hypothetical protein